MIGDSWVLRFSCSDADGAPLDLNAAAVEWSFVRASDGVQVALLTRANGIDIPLTADPNVIESCGTVHLAAEATALLVPGYHHDHLSVVTWNGVLSTQSWGRIEALQV